MGHDEKEVTNAALETAHVRVCRHQVVGRRYFLSPRLRARTRRFQVLFPSGDFPCGVNVFFHRSIQ